MELEGKVALVTGGSGDLGGAIACALGRQGMTVAVTYYGERDRAEACVAEIERLGGKGWTVRLDQSDVDQTERVVEETVARQGRLDVLVNNAATNQGVPFKDLDGLTAEIWDRLYATNLRGPYLLARAAARPMRKQGSGRIVNISSAGGTHPISSSIAYSCTKAAVMHLTRCLAVALAPEVLVNCVAPGLVEGTRMSNRIPAPSIKKALGSAVLERGATAVDVAEEVVPFCRTDSATGQVLAVDAGLFVH
jgi:3-oxoacyl-[acyl-carrier protein] reductase